jgi:hypothetical protein
VTDPDVSALDFLVGRFVGDGVAEYEGWPAQVGYSQELVISRVPGQALLEHRSRSWNPLDGSALAGEVGWWRVAEPGGEQSGEVSLSLAHSTGLLELYLGTVSPGRVELGSDVVVRGPGARAVLAGRRYYGAVGDDLAYVVELAAEGRRLQPHLSARLRRADSA